jgi:hypothetical protein
MRILVVDDEPAVREALERILHLEGFDGADVAHPRRCGARSRPPALAAIRGQGIEGGRPGGGGCPDGAKHLGLRPLSAHKPKWFAAPRVHRSDPAGALAAHRHQRSEQEAKAKAKAYGSTNPRLIA